MPGKLKFHDSEMAEVVFARGDMLATNVFLVAKQTYCKFASNECKQQLGSRGVY